MVERVRVGEAPAMQLAGAPPSPNHQVVVIDADRRARESLAGLIALTPGTTVVATTGRAADALALIDATRADVAVIDPLLPDEGTGLAVVARLRSSFPALRIVAVSGSTDLGRQAVQQGADWFLCKAAPGRWFAEEIGRAMDSPAQVRRVEPPTCASIGVAGMPDSLPGSDAVARAPGEGALEGWSDDET